MDEKIKLMQQEILGNTVSISELSKNYDMSDIEVMSVIYELKKLGNNISSVNKDGEIYVTNFGHNKLVDTSKHYILDDEEEIKFLLMSDLRYGSVFQQKSIINDAMNRACDLGCKYAFIVGDISEGIYSGKRNEVFNDSLFVKDVHDQADYIAENHAYIKGMEQYFITGEHDLTHLNKTYTDIGMLIDEERSDMTYLGQYVKRVAFTNSKNNNEINIMMQHSSGVVPYTVSYKPQQFVVSIRSEDKVDLLLNGHLLTADRFKQRGIYSFSTPSMVATTPEMRKKGINNVIGAWIITINKNSKGEFENISQLFIPYYKTIENDYKKAKTLRREL